MKKVLAIVLALVMVCTMAMAATTETLTAADYKILTKGTNAEVAFASLVKTEAVTNTKTVNGKTTVEYTPELYAADADLYYVTDVSNADAKLVKGTKIVAYLAACDEAPVAVKSATLVAGKSNPSCGECEADVYVVDGVAYEVGGDNYALLGKKVVGYGDEADLEDHDFDDTHTGVVVNYKNTTAGHNTPVSIKCGVCGKTFELVAVNNIPANYVGKTEAVTLGGTNYVALLGNVATTETTTTTNPDTGANDVIGVAAALAVVALVSGAAISLKK